jgi:DNA-binding MarR family transcriptional regulator
MTTQLPDLACKRYIDFINSFNEFKLIPNKIDVPDDHKEKLITFYKNVSADERLYKYLLSRDKLLFHKKYKLVFLPKINLYNLFESNIDENLNSFIWETIQMIYLIIADGQNELSKKQDQIDGLLDRLDGLGKKKGSIDLKKISSVISKIDSSTLTEFLSVAGLDKIDFSTVDIKQFQDIKNFTPDKIKDIIASTGIDKINVNAVIDKLSEKGDATKGQEYIESIVGRLIDDYNREIGKDKMDTILDFAIEKAQDKLQEFIDNGTLTIYDIIAGTKNLKENKNETLTDKLKNSKLFKDGSTISIKEIIARFTSRIMSQVGIQKATGNLSQEQLTGLEEFLKNQKI